MTEYVNAVFEKYDKNKDGLLEMNESKYFFDDLFT